MIDESGPKPRPEISFEEAVAVALNNFLGIRFSLDEREFWSKITPAKTYEEYIKHKYERRPDLSEAVITRTDKTFVDAYNDAMQKINTAIGDGVTSEAQVEELRKRCDEASGVVRDFSQKLRKP